MITFVPGTVLFVSMQDKKVGELIFDHDNRLISGAKDLKKVLGIRIANRVILNTMHQHFHQNSDPGFFALDGKNFSFISATTDALIHPKKKR